MQGLGFGHGTQRRHRSDHSRAVSIASDARIRNVTRVRLRGGRLFGQRELSQAILEGHQGEQPPRARHARDLTMEQDAILWQTQAASGAMR